MRPLISCTLALSACFGSVCAAEDLRPSLAPDIAPGPFTMSLDFAGLIEAAATSKPTSLWWDTAAAKNRAYITQQVDIMLASDKDVPPVRELLQEGRAVVLSGYIQPQDMRNPAFAMAANLGAASTVWKDWTTSVLERRNDSDAATNTGTIRGYTGFYEKENPLKRHTSAFIGFNGDTLLAGMVPSLTNAGTGVRAEHISGAPFTLHIDGDVILKRIQYISENSDYDRYDYRSWSPFIGNLHPRANIQITPKPAGWEGISTISGLGNYTLIPVDEQILRTIPAGSALWATQHLDLATIVTRTQPFIGAREQQMIAGMLGADIPTIASWFSGDISLAVKPGMPLPDVTITIGLRNETSLTNLLSGFAAMAGAQATDITGAQKAWMMAIPNMPSLMYIGIGNDMLTLSTNSANVTTIMNGENLLDTQHAAGTSGFLHLDLPTIAQNYLPLVWNKITSISQPLSRSSLSQARYGIRNIYKNIPKEGVIDTTVIDTALEDVWNIDALKALFPEGDLAHNCLTHVSSWVSADGRDDILLILRSQDGYHDLGSWNSDLLSAEELAERLPDFTHRCGPSIADLPTLTIAPTAMFDSNWLPAPTTIFKHLPVYEISTQTAGAGVVTVNEHGIPLATIFLSAASTVLWFETAERYSRARRSAADTGTQPTDLEDL